MFKGISAFGPQNSIVGLLLKELDLGNKDPESTLKRKNLSIVNVEIQRRLNALENNPAFFN